MPMLSLTCPHCVRENMTFDIVGNLARPSAQPAGRSWFSVAAFCRNCKNPVAIDASLDWGITSKSFGNLAAFWGSTGDLTDFLRIEQTWPPCPKPTAPLHVPVSVERVFLEAEDNRLRTNLESAGAMYRKAFDLSTKVIAPAHASLNLAPRVRQLATAGKLTTDLADWADQIRLLGNSAAHDEGAPTAPEIDDLANLTRMVLTYLFEMPERIRVMRRQATDKANEAG